MNKFLLMFFKNLFATLLYVIVVGSIFMLITVGSSYLLSLIGITPRCGLLIGTIVFMVLLFTHFQYTYKN